MEKTLSFKVAIRDGIIIAAGIIAVRLVMGFIFQWPDYSIPELCCLFLFANVLHLGESIAVHVVAPLFCYAIAGGSIAAVLQLVPWIRRRSPAGFRLFLIVLYFSLIWIPILVFQLNRWGGWM